MPYLHTPTDTLAAPTLAVAQGKPSQIPGQKERCAQYQHQYQDQDPDRDQDGLPTLGFVFLASPRLVSTVVTITSPLLPPPRSTCLHLTGGDVRMASCGIE